MMKEMSIKDIASSSLFDFDCGDEKLNTYLHLYAKQNEEKGVGKTFVLLDDDVVVGFYTLSSAQIQFEELPPNLNKHFPHYPIPAIRIARLGVRKDKQNKGIGSLLLKSAFKRIVSAFINVGISFVVVEAKPEAKGFYEKYGFVCIDEQKLLYVISIFTVIKAMID